MTGTANNGCAHAVCVCVCAKNEVQKEVFAKYRGERKRKKERERREGREKKGSLEEDREVY